MNAETYRYASATMPDVNARQLLASRLRVLLAKRGWRQKHLAERMGLSENWASGVLAAKKGVSFDALDQLATVLKVEVPDLFLDRDLLRHDLSLQQGQEVPRDPAARAQYFA